MPQCRVKVQNGAWRNSQPDWQWLIRNGRDWWITVGRNTSLYPGTYAQAIRSAKAYAASRGLCKITLKR